MRAIFKQRISEMMVGSDEFPEEEKVLPYMHSRHDCLSLVGAGFASFPTPETDQESGEKRGH